MRNLCTLPVSLSVLVCVLTCSAQAGTTVQCLENALPMETLGDDAEQRDLLLSQAETCAREGKPLRAVSLLSQLIKRNPTDASTYINRGSAYAAAGDLGAAISDFSVAIRTRFRSGPSVVRPRYCARQHGPLRERYRRFYRGYQVEARLCLCLLQPGLGEFGTCSL